MCGINGIYGLDQSLSASAVREMNRALQHRGPDDEGEYLEENIALTHKRLSIIDLTKSGKQPMISASGRCIIVYNGELYNYMELRKELKDYQFQTSTDTEVVLAAYERWGSGCLSKFNGMFAFAVWDTHVRKLFLARDRFGIKPLYYYKAEDCLIFSSEIRALLASGRIHRKLNYSSLVDYLRYQTVHAPNTIIQDINLLQPGHYITIDQSGFKVDRYWNFSNSNSYPGDLSYSETCEQVKHLLRDSVQRRLVSDVPFGAFLSGGIDSSAIVALMSEVSDTRISSFSVIFDEKDFSEAKYSDMVARRYNTEHHRINLRANDLVEELPAALSAMDHPSGDGPNTYLISKVTRAAGVTMALSGLGGDEVFAGYDIFKKSLSLESRKWLKNLPVGLRSSAGKLLKALKPGISSDKIAAALKSENMELESFYPYFRQTLQDEQIASLLRSTDLPGNSVKAFAQAELHDIPNDFPLLSKVSVAEMGTYMQNVLLRDTDQMSMAHALEVRVPFLDHELVEFVLGVPDSYKNPVTPKKLLTDSLKGLLPDEIIHRPKMGFTFPWEHWLKNELRAFCEQRLEALADRSYFKSKELMALWSQFLHSHPKVTWSRIWPLVVLENWMQENDIE